MSKYDAIVIGSGQAGNPLCAKLADHGWTVALIEKEHLGGTCVNTGCTPTKTMVASAQVAHYARHAARWGVRAGDVSVDLAKVVARKDQIVSQFRGGVERKVQQRKNLHLHRGHATSSTPTGSGSATRCWTGNESSSTPAPAWPCRLWTGSTPSPT